MTVPTFTPFFVVSMVTTLLLMGLYKPCGKLAMNCAAIRCPVSYAVSTFTSTGAILPY